MQTKLIPNAGKDKQKCSISQPIFFACGKSEAKLRGRAKLNKFSEISQKKGVTALIKSPRQLILRKHVSLTLSAEAFKVDLLRLLKRLLKRAFGISAVAQCC